MYNSMYYVDTTTYLTTLILMLLVYGYIIVSALLSIITLAKLSAYDDRTTTAKVFFSPFAMSDLGNIPSWYPIAAFACNIGSVILAAWFETFVLLTIVGFVLHIMIVCKFGKAYHVGAGRIVAGIFLGTYIINMRAIKNFKAEMIE